MKSYKRLFSLLLCCLFLFGVSSVCVSAEEVEISPYHVYGVGSVTSNFQSQQMGDGMVYIGDGQASVVRLNKSITLSSDLAVYFTMYIGADSGNYLFQSGRDVTAVLESVYCASSISVNGRSVVFSEYFVPQVSIEYIDGTIDYNVSEGFITNNTGNTDLSFSFTPTAEVSKVHVTYSMILRDHNELVNQLGNDMGSTATVWLTFGEMTADKHFLLTVDQKSEEAGLLERIIGRLQGVIDSITNIPARIWEYVENGLKNLFVPDSDYIVAYKDRWTTFLSERFGAVWQVAEMTFVAWEEVQLSDKRDTIEFPEVTIPLPGDNSFTFGGYDVKVVPDGFDFLVDSLKLIVSVVCTLAFINGVRKRYDEIMGVEQ